MSSPRDPTRATLPAVLRSAWSQPGVAVLDLGEHGTLVTWGEEAPISDLRDWRQVARSRIFPDAATPALPYSGGLVGWIGYEAGCTCERQPPPPRPTDTPAVQLWRTNGALHLPREGARWQIGGDPSFKAQAQAVLGRAATRPPLPLPPLPSKRQLPHAPDTQRRYEDGVRSALNHIASGDIYQVNLAWQSRGLMVPDPVTAWLALRAHNPARRGALLRKGATTLISNSPELYLQVRPDGTTLRVGSHPIKGTADATGDGRRRLKESAKEIAELTMIVDLVRNDLGRVCVPGSVGAGQRRLRRCGDLWHAEQAVRGDLRAGLDALDAIGASFPPGSVTGAPKVRAMEIIADLEDQARGPYTGAIGMIADGGAAHLNVAIRTAVVRDGVARLHVGAGIVADSVPELEWAETLAKGRALARLLGAHLQGAASEPQPTRPSPGAHA